MADRKEGKIQDKKNFGGITTNYFLFKNELTTEPSNMYWRVSKGGRLAIEFTGIIFRKKKYQLIFR